MGDEASQIRQRMQELDQERQMLERRLHDQFLQPMAWIWNSEALFDL